MRSLFLAGFLGLAACQPAPTPWTDQAANQANEQRKADIAAAKKIAYPDGPHLELYGDWSGTAQMRRLGFAFCKSDVIINYPRTQWGRAKKCLDLFEAGEERAFYLTHWNMGIGNPTYVDKSYAIVVVRP